MNFKKYHVSRNLFDKKAESMNSWGAVRTELPTGIRTTIQTAGNNRYTSLLLTRGNELLGKTLTISATIAPCASNNGNIRFYWLNNKEITSLISAPLTIKEGNVHGTFTIPNSYPSNTNGIAIILSANVDGNCEVGDYVDYTDVMLNIGDTPLPYEPYSSEVWHDIPYYLHNTSTDTITTLPADIYANAATATVGLKGQTVQSGTPAPDNPIMPQGCGERTGNLWSYQPDTTSVGVTIHWDGEKIVFSNTCTSSQNLSFVYGTLPAGTYTLKANANHIPVDNPNVCIDLYQASPFFQKKIMNNEAVNGTISFTLTENLTDVRLRIRLEGGVNYDGFTLAPMLNSGESSLPYEPYGAYKIPILSAGQTTPVYLGEVQTTRRVKKLVLDGTENWERASNNVFYLSSITDYMHGNYTCWCSHFIACPNQTGTADVPNERICFGSGTLNRLFLNYSSFATTPDLKTYLQQQYAAGTPVTVWYVLATEETAVVNEPLMKIGNFADEVSNISIPVTAGGDTISVGTTVQPSEITANYKGWHPVQNVHERTNGAWT